MECLRRETYGFLGSCEPVECLRRETYGFLGSREPVECLRRETYGFLGSRESVECLRRKTYAFSLSWGARSARLSPSLSADCPSGQDPPEADEKDASGGPCRGGGRRARSACLSLSPSLCRLPVRPGPAGGIQKNPRTYLAFLRGKGRVGKGRICFSPRKLVSNIFLMHSQPRSARRAAL